MLFSREGLAAMGVAVALLACGGGSHSTGGSGTGGAGGRGYRPPEHQLAGCTRLCELERSAMCAAETTFEKCVEDCHLGLLFEVCSEVADDVMACVQAAESAECSSRGTAVIVECTAQGAAINDCIVNDGLSDSLAGPCASFCATSAAPMCPNTTLQDCGEWCRVVSSAFPVCAASFETFLGCGADAEQVCNADGEAEAAVCAATFDAFLACLDGDYAWQPGLGIVR